MYWIDEQDHQDHENIYPLNEINTNKDENTEESPLPQFENPPVIPDQNDPEKIRKFLEIFHYHYFKTSQQRNAILCGLEKGHDMFISMPTGKGKSLIYQFVAVADNEKVSLVINP